MAISNLKALAVAKPWLRELKWLQSLEFMQSDFYGRLITFINATNTFSKSYVIRKIKLSFFCSYRCCPNFTLIRSLNRIIYWMGISFAFHVVAPLVTPFWLVLSKPIIGKIVISCRYSYIYSCIFRCVVDSLFKYSFKLIWIKHCCSPAVFYIRTRCSLYKAWNSINVKFFISNYYCINGV